MSTYWYLEIDALLSVGEEEARTAFAETVSPISHHRHDMASWHADQIDDGVPFAIGSDGDRIDIPEEGWIIWNGRLHACMFIENLTRRRIDDSGIEGRHHDRLLSCLGVILDLEPGLIVGSLAPENSECAGPLIRVGKAIRWMASTAADPARLDDPGPQFAEIRRIPVDLLTDPGDGLTCAVDLKGLRRFLEQGDDR